MVTDPEVLPESQATTSGRRTAPKQKRHLVLHIRSLKDNELQDVNFEVGIGDNWQKWANDMVENKLILKEHAESMANALRLIMENEIEEITFKLDKNADPATLDKQKLIGYVQLKRVKT